MEMRRVGLLVVVGAVAALTCVVLSAEQLDDGAPLVTADPLGGDGGTIITNVEMPEE
jgi:hypothetical protein